MAPPNNSGVGFTTQARASQSPQIARSPFQKVDLLPFPDAPLPVGMLEMAAQQVLSPTAINWLYVHNTARIEWAVRRGLVAKGKIACSPTTGLITFPGLDDATFLPEEARKVEPGNPQPIHQALWGEFLENIDIGGVTPRCWKKLPYKVLLWSYGCNPSNDQDLRQASAIALEDYLIHFVPIHLAYLLLPATPGNSDWLSGKLKRGRISEECLERCLSWGMDGQRQPGADAAICIAMAGVEQLPFEHGSRDALGEIFDKCSRPAIPRIFRHLFAGDRAFCETLALKLTLRYGVYEELDFNQLILPLSDTWEEEKPLTRRRLGAPEVGLIAFD